MNELLKKLEDSILEGRTLHAYLISGNDPGVTDAAALNAASLMLYGRKDHVRLKNDPDYLEYSGSVAIGEFRDVIRPELYRETYGKAGRVAVFLSAEQLSIMVQNAMLKVLEEPPEDTYFILTGNEYGILPTIRSRCMVIRCADQDVSAAREVLIEAGCDAERASENALYSGGVAARALRMYSDDCAWSLRDGVISAFFSSLAGVPDFKWTKVKRDRSDFVESNETLLILCHDLERVACGMEPEFCTDKAKIIKKFGSRVTIGQIGCIIDRLKENAQRLSVSAAGGACFDRLFAELAAIGRRSR